MAAAAAAEQRRQSSGGRAAAAEPRQSGGRAAASRSQQRESGESAVLQRRIRNNKVFSGALVWRAHLHLQQLLLQSPQSINLPLHLIRHRTNRRVINIPQQVLHANLLRLIRPHLARNVLEGLDNLLPGALNLVDGAVRSRRDLGLVGAHVDYHKDGVGAELLHERVDLKVVAPAAHMGE